MRPPHRPIPHPRRSDMRAPSVAIDTQERRPASQRSNAMRDLLLTFTQGCMLGYILSAKVQKSRRSSASGARCEWI